MRIKKFGHCCLLIEEQGVKFLTDPGAYNDFPEVTGLDAVFITHDHADHCHAESVKRILEANPGARVFTNAEVGKLLDEAGVSYTLVHDGDSFDTKGVPVSVHGNAHALMLEGVPVCENNGFFIGEKLFYPGDAFTDPGKPVDVLALPVGGPWLRLSDSIGYAQRVKPRVVFPVHDGMLMPERRASTRHFPKTALAPLGIEFVDLNEGSEAEF